MRRRFGLWRWADVQKAGRLRLSESGVRQRALQYVAACMRAMPDTQSDMLSATMLDCLADAVVTGAPRAGTVRLSMATMRTDGVWRRQIWRRTLACC
jgi:hypothetical protein